MYTSADTRPIDVIVSKFKPDMFFYNKKDNTIHLVELTVPFKNNIQKAQDRKAQKYTDLVSDILDNGSTCNLTCFEITSRSLITSENIRNIDKSSLLLIPSCLSHSGRNSAMCPFWPATPSGTLERSRPGALKYQPLPSAWFSLHLGVALSFAGFWISLPLTCCCCIKCFCVYTALRRRELLGSLLVLGLNVLPFVMHFALIVCIVWIKVDIAHMMNENSAKVQRY